MESRETVEKVDGFGERVACRRNYKNESRVNGSVLELRLFSRIRFNKRVKFTARPVGGKTNWSAILKLKTRKGYTGSGRLAPAVFMSSGCGYYAFRFKKSVPGLRRAVHSVKGIVCPYYYASFTPEKMLDTQKRQVRRKARTRKGSLESMENVFSNASFVNIKFLTALFT